MTQLPDDAARMLRCSAVARILNCCCKHVYRLIRQGDLDAVRVGRRQFRVTRESLEELLRVWRRDQSQHMEEVGDTRAKARTWRRRPLKLLLPAMVPRRDTDAGDQRDESAPNETVSDSAPRN